MARRTAAWAFGMAVGLVVGRMFTGLRWVVGGDLRVADGVEGSWEAPPHAATCGPISCARRIVGRELLLGGGSGGTARLWDARSRTPAGGWFARWGAVTAVCVDRPGGRVVTGGTDGNVVVWDTRSSRATAVVHATAWVGCLARSEERGLAIAETRSSSWMPTSDACGSALAGALKRCERRGVHSRREARGHRRLRRRPDGSSAAGCAAPRGRVACVGLRSGPKGA